MRYVGPFDLRGGQAVFRFDGGHIYIPFTQTYQPHFFCYHVNDHLGNVRVTKVGVGEGGSVLQRMNYYPFGGMMASSTGGAVQPYRYTGKELVRFQGLDWLDYGARWYDPTIARWNGVDELAEKYHSVSPYVYCLDNPVRCIDPDGRRIVDSKGRNAVVYCKGRVSFTKYASNDVKRIVNALCKTSAGRNILYQAVSSDVQVKMTLSSQAKIKGNSYTYGETLQGNYNANDNYGKIVNKDGSFGIKEATVIVYEGTLKEDAKTSDPKHKGVSTDDAIGAVAGHELVHAIDKAEIHKDIKYEMEHNGQVRKDRETKPNKVETEIINEILLNELK